MLPPSIEAGAESVYEPEDKPMTVGSFHATIAYAAGPASALTSPTPSAPSATLRQALNLMSTYNVSQLPVIDGGEGVGADRKSTRLNSSHYALSRMPSSA